MKLTETLNVAVTNKTVNSIHNVPLL